MKILRLSDGTEYELDWCSGDKGVFYANIVTDSSFYDLVLKFSNPELTNHMEADYDEVRVVEYEGYTKLMAVSFDNWSTGTVLITLKTPDIAA